MANWLWLRLRNQSDGGTSRWNTHIWQRSAITDWLPRVQQKCNSHFPFQKKCKSLWAWWECCDSCCTMACYPTAWLTSTETLGSTCVSSSLHGPGRRLHSPSTTKQNRPPFSAFPAFPTNNCQRKQNACRYRFVIWARLTPHSLKSLLTSEPNLAVGRTPTVWAEVKTATAAILARYWTCNYNGVKVAANFGEWHWHPEQESLSAAERSLRSGMASVSAITHDSQWEEFQGHNSPQSVTSHRCTTPMSRGLQAVRLCSCMSVCTCDRRTGSIQPSMSGPVLQASDTLCTSGLLGCPGLCRSVMQLPRALDSLWHICTRAKPAGPHWALLLSTGASLLCLKFATMALH